MFLTILLKGQMDDIGINSMLSTRIGKIILKVFVNILFSEVTEEQFETALPGMENSSLVLLCLPIHLK